MKEKEISQNVMNAVIDGDISQTIERAHAQGLPRHWTKELISLAQHRAEVLEERPGNYDGLVVDREGYLPLRETLSGMLSYADEHGTEVVIGPWILYEGLKGLDMLETETRRRRMARRVLEYQMQLEEEEARRAEIDAELLAEYGHPQ